MTDKTKDKIYYPIFLKSNLTHVRFNNRVVLKRIDDVECQKGLGINDEFTFDEDGFIVRHKTGKVNSFRYRLAIPAPLSPEIHLIWTQVNFVLIVHSHADAELFQCALKLAGPQSASGFFFGYRLTSSGYEVHYIYPASFSDRKPFEINEGTVKLLVKLIVKLTAMKDDKKLALMLQKFQYSLSSEHLLETHRFLDLAIILEMLLLPAHNTELKYRFSLRFAKLFHKNNVIDKTVAEAHKYGKLIYDIRSKIVHNGFDNRIKSNLASLKEITQKAILLYLENKSLFEEKYLDKLCLDNL